MISVAWLLLLFLLGAAVLTVIDSETSAQEVAGFSFPLGSSVLTFVLFLAGWAGLKIDLRLTLGGAVSLLLISLLVIRRQRRRRLGGLAMAFKDWTHPQGLLLMSLVLLLLVAAFIGVGRSYSSYDAAAGWAIKGYGIALQGDVQAAADWGTWGKAYPLNLPLQIGLFEVVGGDGATLSKLIFPIYLGSLLAGCYWFWRRHRVPRTAAILTLLIIATIRLVFYHATIGYANLPFATYLVLGTLLAIEGWEGQRPRLLAISGLMLGSAAWTRAEGLGFVALIFITLALPHIALRRRLPRGRVLPTVLIPPAVAVPWLLFARQGIAASHLGEAASGFLPRVLAGQLNLFQLYLIPRLFAERAAHPDNMGLFVPVVLALWIAGVWRARPWEDLPLIQAVTTSAVMVLVPIGLFYVRSFTRPDDFRELLVRSFDRAFLPATFMLIIVGIWMVFGGQEGPGRLAEE